MKETGENSNPFKQKSFDTEEECPLSHVVLFATSGYIKMGSFGFYVKNFNKLRD